MTEKGNGFIREQEIVNPDLMAGLAAKLESMDGDQMREALLSGELAIPLIPSKPLNRKVKLWINQQRQKLRTLIRGRT